MKKITHILIPFLALFTMVTSCNKDLLNQNSPDQLTTDNFYTSKEKALSGLSAAYSQLEGFVAWDNFVEARSVREFYREDYVLPGDDAYNYSWWMDHYNFKFTSGNYAIDLLWKDNYRGINFANQVLENVAAMPADKIDDQSRKQILAEAKFLRAYYHFKLLTNFEKIIIREKVPKSESDLPKAISERKESYTFIIADLKDAVVDLPKKSQRPASELGRITKGAAEAYLGKVLLYRAGEDAPGSATYLAEAASAFKGVVTSGDYNIDPDFIGMFNGTVKNGVESVFELQQTADAANGAVYRSYLSDWVAPSELGGYGEIYGTQRLITEMKKEGTIASGNKHDPRLYGTMIFEDSWYNDVANPRVYGSTYNQIFKNGSGISAFKKWVPSEIGRLGRSLAINMPLMRYADVLLMYAEVLNNQDKPADAMIEINKLRNKREMPSLNLTTKAQVFDQIVHERVMEFTLEGSRFYDLRRWGLLQQNMTAAGRSFSADKAFYPLPLKETINNPLIN